VRRREGDSPLASLPPLALNDSGAPNSAANKKTNKQTDNHTEEERRKDRGDGRVFRYREA
jgi:hypothetical protein